MYLARLNDEEKELFLGIAYNLALADGVYSEKEEAMLDAYGKEMDIKVECSNMRYSTNEIVEKLKRKCSLEKKKIILFECTGLAMIDGTYDENEKNFILNMQMEFGIEENFVFKCEKVLRKYIFLQDEINRLVFDQEKS